MKRRKRLAVTLIEIMIVILLIGMITGALAFNMAGSLDKGRAFKTEQTIARVRDLLLLEYATGTDDLKKITEQWRDVIQRSPLVLDKGENLLTDGWKEPLKVTCPRGELVITSSKLQKYKARHARPRQEAQEQKTA